MTEQEYIYVRDISNVRIARKCIADLNPGASVMTEAEHFAVAQVLKRWEESLFERAKVSA